MHIVIGIPFLHDLPIQKAVFIKIKACFLPEAAAIQTESLRLAKPDIWTGLMNLEGIYIAISEIRAPFLLVPF